MLFQFRGKQHGKNHLGSFKSVAITVITADIFEYLISDSTQKNPLYFMIVIKKDNSKNHELKDKNN